MKRSLLTGNQAVAHGVRLSKPDIIAGYPITPSTSIIETLAEMISKHELDSVFLKSESEYSVMGTLIGASAAGARTFTATAAHGLAYMHELLHWAAGSRLPIVMAVANRGLGSPWCLLPDQNDTLSQRDTGWIQIYCETGQEILDTTIQAFRIAESVLLPVMVVLEGFYGTHVAEPVMIPSDEPALAFACKKPYPFVIDPDKPMSYGGATDPASYQKMRLDMHKAMLDCLKVIEGTGAEFGKTFGRSYSAIETYMLEDAHVALVTSGSTTGTARSVVDSFRERGRKAGLLKVRAFRPFPGRDIVDALSKVETACVVDRNISFGLGGIFASEIRSAINSLGGKTEIRSHVMGLGGKDITENDLSQVLEEAFKTSGASGARKITGVQA